MIDLYRTLWRIAVAEQIQYRASGVIWIIGGILDPVIFLIVWATVARGQGGEVGGYTPRQFAAYYLTLIMVNHLTFTWIMHEFQWRVQEGVFSSLLLRPVHPIHADVASNFAFKTVMMVFMAPAVVVLAVWFRPDFDTEPWAIVAAIPCLLLALLLRFFMGWTLAMAAFWTVRTNALNQAYFAMMLIFSGRIAPVSFLPDWLQRVGDLLPFYWQAAFPVELIIGRIGPEDALRGMAIQAAWVLVWLGILAASWRIAVRRYAAVGG